MKINKVIFSVDDNPIYADFWPLQAKLVKKIFKAEPILFYITDEDSDFYYDGNGTVKKINKNNCFNVPTSFQSQVVRMYATKYFPDEICLTADIDMLMLNKNYFVKQIETIDNESLVIMDSKSYDLERTECQNHNESCKNRYPICYIVGKGKIFNKILNTDRSFEQYVDDLQKLELGWGTDELYFGDKVDNMDHGVNIIKLIRNWSTPWKAEKRIDRHNFPTTNLNSILKDAQKRDGVYDLDKLKSGYYIDAHCPRPYKDYKKEINELVDMVLNNTFDVNNKICYVCCCYLGDRRFAIENYKKDKTLYIKEHVKSLQEFNHNLDKIIFIFNLDPEHISLFEQIKKEIPQIIQNTEVEIIIRENYGMSYAAFNEVYEKYRTKFDYYIFNEDDYYFNDHNFDTYLINKFKSYSNIGYLATMIANPAWNFQHNLTHAGNSVGMTSSKILEELYQKFGCLPHSKHKKGHEGAFYSLNEMEGQIAQTHEIFKLGYNLFDIREDYSIPHDMGFKLKEEIPEFDHFVDHFFYWNKPLVIPASIRFNIPTWHVLVTDPQFQSKRSCYIVSFYFGNRRRTVSEFEKDRLLFLKKQIETLQTYYHNLDKIIFSFNVEPEHYNYINEALKIIPQNIQNTPTEIIIRENKGFSYSAFSEAFGNNRDKYDYFIFNEDDYFLVENNWDEYLIRKYHTFPDPGYLCAIQRDEDEWNNYKSHAGHTFGIASTSALNKVWEKYGCLPNSYEIDYEIQQKVQINFSHAFFEVGLRVYDIREDYRVSFAMTGVIDQDIWRWFWWNEKDLIVPAIILLNKPYTWYESFDGPMQRRTNLEKYEQF